MQIKDILTNLGELVGSGMSKTASEEKPDVPVAEQELVTALNTALNASAEVEKTASEGGEGSTTHDLVKIASDLANAEQEALEKEANLYGSAVADGFVSRLSQYTDAVADQPAVKTAAAAPVEVPAAPATAPTEEDFSKFAQENPELVKQAVELGFRDAKDAIENAKQAATQKGYNDTVAAVQKMAEEPDGETKLAALKAEANAFATQSPSEQEKQADVKEGYDDTVQEIEKLAGDCYQRGYDATMALLQEV